MPNLYEMANEVRANIRAAEEKLEQIQHACSHPVEMVTIKHQFYTTHNTCGICGKFWIVHLGGNNDNSISRTMGTPTTSSI